MKKLLSVLGVLLGCSSMLLADNTMKMVTYFPVPYVAYSQVHAKEQMDIGLSGACELNLGSSTANKSLNIGNLNLLQGKLYLQGQYDVLVTKQTAVGAGSGEAEMDFSSLTVSDIENGLTVESGNFNPAELKLFPSQASKSSTFPTCNDGNGGHNMSWQHVTLKDSSELYLVCGDVPEPKRCENLPRLMQDYDGYNAGEVDLDAEGWACCENGRLIEDGTESDISEEYLDSWYCCGPVFVCCQYPDGSRGQCAELGSGQEPKNCYLAGGGSHAVTTCYTSSSGGSTPPPSSGGTCDDSQKGTKTTTNVTAPCDLGSGIPCSSYTSALVPSGCNCEVVSVIKQYNNIGGICDYDLKIKIY